MTQRADHQGRRVKVTVLMPAYNAAPFIDEAIGSVLCDADETTELLIIDDGSTDDTCARVAEWSRRDGRVRSIPLKQNVGITLALNIGVDAARGKYIARQDADDIWMLGRLERQARILDAHPEVILVSSGFELMNSRGKRVGRVMRLNSPAVTDHLLNFSNIVGGHGQVMYRRDEVLRLGGYLVECELAEDYDLWCRMADVGKIVTLPFIGMRQRQHDQRLSIRRADRQFAQTLEVSRKRLSSLLQREVTPIELSPAAIVWRGLTEPVSARSANSLMREAFTRARDLNDADRRQIRLQTAWRWTVSALRLAAKRSFGAAIMRVAYAHRWHPAGLLSGMILRLQAEQALSSSPHKLPRTLR